MWNNPLVAENIEKLKGLGYSFVGPEKGKLACGDDDIGRMSEPEEIVQEVVRLLGGSQDLKGKNFLVTAGGTREAIDAVRYISNRSSGKMGYALAGAARERGAAVTLISANVALLSPLDIKPLRVDSAGKMLEAVSGNFESADVVIMAAAVSDYTPRESSNSKLKKKAAPLSLELQPTRDILKSLSQHSSRKGKLLVGFALETDGLIANARQKLKEKDLDYIVANNTSSFGEDRCRLSLISRDGHIEEFPLLPKTEAANRLLDRIK
jgi:phosphopantothenoylcysteine decarboxylase/phosphopantothenate--cysteine ligase